jgi:hypothetical protein
MFAAETQDTAAGILVQCVSNPVAALLFVWSFGGAAVGKLRPKAPLVQ